MREISAADFPHRSLKIHPTQIYASVSAVLISGLLWFFYPMRRFDGQVLALLLITYAIARYFEEAIRVDEKGQLGTQLSISQWISFGVLAAGVGVWVVAQRWNDLKKS
jgi:phosphatidylglycerol---prolipoprotein diacylglyceryl transferase